MSEYLNQHVTDYWVENYTGKFRLHCSLCGNAGVIDTRGVTTPAGVPAGMLNWCICPNGQLLRSELNRQPREGDLRNGDQD